MILHTEYEQGSVEWMLARAGIPTASEFDNLLTPAFKVRDGEMPETYLDAKIDEAWTGGPGVQFNTFDMDQGHILEQEAVPWYEFEFSEPIQRVAFATTDDGRIGCSPDGLIGDDGGIEIKCPQGKTHAGYLRRGGVPKKYLAQVHGAMFVTGRKWWKFLSYHRRYPPLLVLVERDEKIQEAIGEALEMFLANFDRAMAHLTDLNGGPPKRRTPTPTPAAYSAPLDDIPH